ncbi:restriction modification system DNA specificity subunit [Mycobacterium tuberculosis]|nr:restriction modification system DNA specificity subunit [Mycobacterium tuberculosis]
MILDLAPWLKNSRWQTVPIRFLARQGTGHTPSRQHPEYWENCTIPWITLADVWQLRDGTRDTITETKEKISPLGLAHSAAVVHPKGTVILSRTASVGFSGIMGADMATSQDFATWTCGPKLVPRFLLHALRAMAPDLKRIAAGSTHKTIYMPDIERIRIPVPPLEEQRRIADFLDAETAHIDHLISLRVSQHSLLVERLFASVSRAFVTDGSVDLVRLGYLATVQTGITVDGSRSTSGEVITRPYLRVANVQAGHLRLDSVVEITVPVSAANSSTLRPGDVLMTEGGDLDKLGRGTVWHGEIPNCLHQNHVFAVRPNERLDPEYLALLTRSAYARMYFESTGTKSTNLASTSSSKIRDFRVPLVALRRQQDVVCRLHSELREGESLLSLLDGQKRLLEERRRAVVTAAVTGKLDVTTARRTSHA